VLQDRHVTFRTYIPSGVNSCLISGLTRLRGNTGRSRLNSVFGVSRRPCVRGRSSRPLHLVSWSMYYRFALCWRPDSSVSSARVHHANLFFGRICINTGKVRGWCVYGIVEGRKLLKAEEIRCRKRKECCVRGVMLDTWPGSVASPIHRQHVPLEIYYSLRSIYILPFTNTDVCIYKLWKVI
jgi:hypothetical protein